MGVLLATYMDIFQCRSSSNTERNQTDLYSQLELRNLAKVSSRSSSYPQGKVWCTKSLVAVEGLHQGDQTVTGDQDQGTPGCLQERDDREISGSRE